MDGIRRYEPGDRAVVRAICHATAYGDGSHAQPIDPRLFTDLMTRYHTDFAADALWVSELRGRVVGYLAGCFDGRAQRNAMLWPIVPAGVAMAVARGLLFRSALWRLAAAVPYFLAAEWRAVRGAPRSSLDGYPAHLHINLLPEARGRGVGERLVKAFLAEAGRRGLPGVHVTVLEENRAARRFFEKLGFAPLMRRPAFRPPSRRGHLDEKIVLTRALAVSGPLRCRTTPRDGAA
jgi:ribosomal protein S18 acetylase RimI-like enzyme